MLIACITREDTRHLSPRQVDELRERERQYYRSLQASPELNRSYFAQSGQGGNVLIFEVASPEELHHLVMLGPMALYQKTDVYPLLPLPELGDLILTLAGHLTRLRRRAPMLFAILTEADPRDLLIPKYLETVHQANETSRSCRPPASSSRPSCARAWPEGSWLIEADSRGAECAASSATPRRPTRAIRRSRWQCRAVSPSKTATIQAPVEFVYALLWEVERWPTLLPHVQRIHLREQAQDYQDFNMQVAYRGDADQPLHPAGCARSPHPRQPEQVEPLLLFRWHNGAWCARPAGRHGGGGRQRSTPSSWSQPRSRPSLGRTARYPRPAPRCSVW